MRWIYIIIAALTLTACATTQTCLPPVNLQPVDGKALAATIEQHIEAAYLEGTEDGTLRLGEIVTGVLDTGKAVLELTGADMAPLPEPLCARTWGATYMTVASNLRLGLVVGGVWQLQVLDVSQPGADVVHAIAVATLTALRLSMDDGVLTGCELLAASLAGIEAGLRVTGKWTVEVAGVQVSVAVQEAGMAAEQWMRYAGVCEAPVVRGQ